MNNNTSDNIIRTTQNSLSSILGSTQYYQTTPVTHFTLKEYNELYTTLFQRAQQVDTLEELTQTFSQFLNIAEQTAGVHRAITDLKTIYTEFTTTQYQLASTYAQLGIFEETQQHLQQAITGIKSNLFEFTPPITEEQHQQIIETALKQSPLSYFTDKAQAAADSGDIETTLKYIQLTGKKLTLERKIKTPSTTPYHPHTSGNATFYQFQKEAAKVHQRAYKFALNKKIEEAVERALKSNTDSYRLDYFPLNQKLIEIKELCMDYVTKFHTSKNSVADEIMFSYFNDFLNPFFDALHECAQDKNHPLRTIYTIKSRDRTKSEGIIFKEPGTNITPTSLYTKVTLENRIYFPITIDYEKLARKYGILS